MSHTEWATHRRTPGRIRDKQLLTVVLRQHTNKLAFHDIFFVFLFLVFYLYVFISQQTAAGACKLAEIHEKLK